MRLTKPDQHGATNNLIVFLRKELAVLTLFIP